MNEIAKLKAKEEKKRLESEVRLALYIIPLYTFRYKILLMWNVVYVPSKIPVCWLLLILFVQICCVLMNLYLLIGIRLLLVFGISVLHFCPHSYSLYMNGRWKYNLSNTTKLCSANWSFNPFSFLFACVCALEFSFLHCFIFQLEMVLIVEKLQELRSIRIQKLTKQGGPIKACVIYIYCA